MRSATHIQIVAKKKINNLKLNFEQSQFLVFFYIYKSFILSLFKLLTEVAL